MIAQKSILVVEDNQINRMMLTAILSSEYRILEAENGQEALQVLQEHRDELSLILLDIVMPVMDGYTFLSIVKADPVYASIPVIVTTQNDAESDEVAALSHGAADFVAKPYRPQIILHRVASIINLRETAAMINQVQYDKLTGLYSKEFFYQRVKEILVQRPQQSFDILCSDIENFKLVNDVFGVPAGNRLLCGVADLYTELAGAKGICGRLHADQFACLIERQPEYTNAMFIQAGAQINTLPNMKNVIMKWGVYSIEDRAVSVEQMCDRALLAARSIKGQYGKYYASYDDTLRSKLLREQAITEGMEAALAERQFEVYLQPKYRIKDGNLAGAEALVRWNHPQWGLQSPAVFIPLFERNGFITQLDQFVWDRACEVLRGWDDHGHPPISVSVNVSRADIYNADIADILMKTVQKYQLPPARLHLEITESAYTENPHQIIETVNHLRDLGFVIEMDDFGSGYSSLNMLNQMPLDILKLDMKFIQSETAKPVNQGILRFIMGLARWMHLSVVAEGVETKEQLTRLREIGCDYVQGYLFGKPMPCADFEQLFKVRRPDAGQEPTDPAGSQEERPTRVLLVADEDASYREQVQTTFADLYQVTEAPDSRAAMDYVTDYGHKLAAVIVSLTLPDLDGCAALDRLQQEKAVWNIPVIATGPSDPLLEAEALKRGADDFACKPHLQSSLLKRVQRAVGTSASWEQERILRDEAYRDYPTGLLNRRGLHVAVDALRREDAPYAFYLFGLNHLKQINDQFGHSKGDQLIVQFGELLRAHARETDSIARLGGAEFIVVMKKLGTEELALKKGEAICRAFRENNVAQEIPATASAGVVIWNAEGSLDAVLTKADEALARAKAGGTDCCLWRG